MGRFDSPIGFDGLTSFEGEEKIEVSPKSETPTFTYRGGLPLDQEERIRETERHMDALREHGQVTIKTEPAKANEHANPRAF